MPLKPTPKATPSPTALPSGDVLPFDSTLLFVLDDPIASNKSKVGELVRVHLKTPIVIGGRTVAPAGTPATIRIVDFSGADIADTYGFVDIFFEPMTLPDGRVVPLRAPVARLEPHVSSGHESTVAAEDTVGDIFVPYYVFWQILRHGKNFVMREGSEIPARTDATIAAQPNGSIAILTPRPLTQSSEVPDATFPVQPVVTPLVTMPPTPRPRPSPSPTPTP